MMIQRWSPNSFLKWSLKCNSRHHFRVNFKDDVWTHLRITSEKWVHLRLSLKSSPKWCLKLHFGDHFRDEFKDFIVQSHKFLTADPQLLEVMWYIEINALSNILASAYRNKILALLPIWAPKYLWAQSIVNTFEYTCVHVLSKSRS